MFTEFNLACAIVWHALSRTVQLRKVIMRNHDNFTGYNSDEMLDSLGNKKAPTFTVN